MGKPKNGELSAATDDSLFLVFGLKINVNSKCKSKDAANTAKTR